jgi:hypothetical protein
MPDGIWVIADGTRFRLCESDEASPFLCRHLLETGDAEHVRQGLAGAMMAGLQFGRRRHAAPAPAGAPTLERYIWSLAGAYLTTEATPRTMRAAAERLRAQGNSRAADYCRDVADDEDGHDRLALKDLDALGIRSAAFVATVKPANAVARVELFARLAGSATPIAVLGYAYALERAALSRTAAAIAAIEAIVPPGTMATRCLRVHSAVGTDADHVGQSLAFIAGLAAPEREQIARAVFETAAIMTVPDGYPGDDAFRAMLTTMSSLDRALPARP